MNDEEICNLYLNGTPIRHISLKSGISRKSISKLLKLKGIRVKESHEARREFITDEIKRNIVSDYLSGCSQNVINIKYSVCFPAIARVLEEANIKSRTILEQRQTTRKYTFNQKYFDKINSWDKAYWLGFLYADGCNYTKRANITLTVHKRDGYILNNFSNQVGESSPIRIRENRSIFLLQSRHMSESLIKLGCVARKSLILKFPIFEQVPEEFIKAFVLGFFDGDGHIGVYPNGKTGMRCKITFCSTLEFLTSLGDFLLKMGISKVQIHKASHKTKSNTYVLCINTNSDKYKFYELFYKNRKYCLTRKEEKFKEFLFGYLKYPKAF